MKGLKGLKAPGVDPGLGVGGAAERRGAGGVRHTRRDGNGGQAGGLEIARRRRRQLVVRFDVLIIAVRIDHQLVAINLVAGAQVTAVTLRFRKGERELIEIKPGKLAARRADARCPAVEISARRGQAIGAAGRARELQPARRGYYRPPASATAALVNCRLYGLAFELRNGGTAE